MSKTELNNVWGGVNRHEGLGHKLRDQTMGIKT